MSTPETADPELILETARLLRACREWVRRYVVVSDEQSHVLAAWILHTWTIHAAAATPYLHVCSAELGCGKSTLLRTLRAVVREPRYSDNMSPAALARIVGTVRPTLLIDELDAVLQADKDRAHDLRGILNGGFEVDGTYTRCVGRDFKVEHFPTFCPKVLSGIGELWPTVASRAIRIELRRKLASESVDSFRSKRVHAEAEPLRRELEAWADRAAPLLQAMNEPPDVPGLDYRQMDISEPLLCIAALAGAEWLQRLTAALQSIFGATRTGNTESTSVTLLRDVRTIFDERNADRLPSATLAERLCGIEGRPWADWNHGQGLNANGLARQLQKYGIHPQTIRTTAGTPKGYRREDFLDTWNRLCPSPPVQAATPPQPASLLAEATFSKRNTTPNVADVESGSSPHGYCSVADVAVPKGADRNLSIETTPASGSCGYMEGAL